MKKALKSLCIASVAALVVLAGCGGGGGGGSTPSDPVTPPLNDSRVITGRVVSTASGSPGVPNVLVSIGDRAASAPTGTTDSNGYFRINMGAVAIPSFIQVNSSNAGTGYDRVYTVAYNGQEYESDSIDVPIAVRNEASMDMGTLKVVYVNPNSDTPPPVNLFPSHDTVIYGRVIRSDTSAGLAGVTVTFGSPAVTATTGAKGYFALNLGLDAGVVARFPTSPWTFAINSSTAGTSYPTTLEVRYSTNYYAQTAIPVPDDVILQRSNDLGTLVLQVSPSNGGGDGPPPPPEM